MTESDWTYLMAVLQAMKQGLVFDKSEIGDDE